MSIRPGPSGDPEGEEVALRLTEAGALNDLFRAWNQCADEDEERVIRLFEERISGYLGRPFRVIWPQAQAWWRAFDREALWDEPVDEAKDEGGEE